MTKQAGFTLLEAMITIFLLSLFGLFATKAVQQTMYSMAELERIGEAVDVRSVLRNRFSCEMTSAKNNSCAGRVQMYDVAGEPILDDEFGDFEILASCQEYDGYNLFDLNYRRAGEEDFAHLMDGIGIACATSCKFSDPDFADSELAEVKMPMPIIGPTKILPFPWPAFIYPHEASLLFVHGGPRINVAAWYKKQNGVQVGADYRFNFTAYKEIPSDVSSLVAPKSEDEIDTSMGPLFGWVMNISGMRLIEAEYQVTIKNADSASCTVESTSLLVSRGQIAGNASGCLLPGTLVATPMGDIPVELLQVGDQVLLADGRATPIEEVRRGPETKPYVALATDQGLLRLTQTHPVQTGRGLLQAKAVRPDDTVATAGGMVAVRSAQLETPQTVPMVYNLRINSHSPQVEDHLIIADGLVVGDLHLQEQLEQAEASEALALESTQFGGAYDYP